MLALLVLLVLISTQSPAQKPLGAVQLERSVLAMGTTLRIRVAGRTREAALVASEAVARTFEREEARLSTWRRESELSRLNRAPAGRPFRLSRGLRDDLRAARYWHRLTKGAFDPGVGGLVDLWDLRGEGRLPEPAAVARAVASGGFARLELAGDDAIRRSAAMRIEEGGFAKGRALDAAVAAARDAGATAATLDIGGQLAFFGNAPAVLGIAHPVDRTRVVAELRLPRGSIATSGNGERGLVVQGRRVGHLLDPRTGRPARDFGSVTVWAPDATAADCLATGLYVLGPEAALAWVERHRGVEAVIVEDLGDRLRIRASSGLREKIRGRGHAIELTPPTPTKTRKR